MRNLFIGCSVVFVLFAIVGCATTANYNKILNTWVGSHVDRLVSSWGPPQNSFPLSSGGQVIEYVTSRNVTVGGFTTYKPQTTYHSGSVYGSYGGYGSGVVN